MTRVEFLTSLPNQLGAVIMLVVSFIIEHIFGTYFCGRMSSEVNGWFSKMYVSPKRI